MDCKDIITAPKKGCIHSRCPKCGKVIQNVVKTANDPRNTNFVVVACVKCLTKGDYDYTKFLNKNGDILDSKLMINYKEQDGCYNCKYAHLKLDIDMLQSYYCCYGCMQRPKDGTLSEQWNSNTEETFKADYNAWFNWADEREVKPWAICDNHKK